MMKQKNSGFIFIEFIFVVILVILIVMIIPLFSRSKTTISKTAVCKANLSMFGISSAVYQLDFGKQIYFPQKQGQGFLLALYTTAILPQTHVYICPSTPDTNHDGADFLGAPELGDEVGPVSYAGRINSDQSSYPGLFRLTEDRTTTPLACDDLTPGKNIYTENHEQGKVINILFLDGHVDHIRDQDGVVNNRTYFNKKTSPYTGTFNPLAN